MTNESFITYDNREYLVLCNEKQRMALDWMINAKGWRRAALGYLRKHKIPQIPYNKKG